MLLFVNLQIAVTRSGITVGVATASAQTMMYEELPGVEVVGNLYDCKWGGGQHMAKNMLEAHESTCSLRKETCTICGQEYPVVTAGGESHNCQKKDTGEGTGDTGSGNGDTSNKGNGGGSSGSVIPGSGKPDATKSARNAADYATAHAYPQYVKGKCGYCARAVRLALQNSGFSISPPYPQSAKQYGPVLTGLGFSEIPKDGYVPQAGGVRVFQPAPGGSVHGHIDIYNGSKWVSDFVEQKEFPGQKYENSSYKIYRQQQ